MNTTDHQPRIWAWKWTCTVCPATGEATDADGMDAGTRHAASHTPGPLDIVPTIHVERTKPRPLDHPNKE